MSSVCRSLARELALDQSQTGGSSQSVATDKTPTPGDSLAVCATPAKKQRMNLYNAPAERTKEDHARLSVAMHRGKLKRGKDLAEDKLKQINLDCACLFAACVCVCSRAACLHGLIVRSAL